jgi:hypothetical protein
MEPKDQKETGNSINPKPITTLPEEILKTMKKINHQNKCQYQSPNCSGKGEFQHTLKLGSVKISKQWVCGNCKKVLEQKK